MTLLARSSCSRSRLARGLASVGLAAALAGCFGGGGDGPVTPPAPTGVFPSSATSSVAALIDYLSGLMADDSTEALDIAGIDLPTSETAEPLPVN